MGKDIVVDDARVFSSVGPHDIVIVQVLEFRPVPRFSVLPVSGALGLYNIRWHSQGDDTVGRPATAGSLCVVMLDADVIAEKFCPLAAGVGDQGLRLAEFKSEGFPEKS